MKNKKTVVIILATIFFIIIIFLIKNNYKFLKKGNNISNKSADEIKEYILNIESYQAIDESGENKNTGKIIPIYPLTYGISQNTIRKIIRISRRY